MGENLVCRLACAAAVVFNAPIVFVALVTCFYRVSLSVDLLGGFGGVRAPFRGCFFGHFFGFFQSNPVRFLVFGNGGPHLWERSYPVGRRLRRARGLVRIGSRVPRSSVPAVGRREGTAAGRAPGHAPPPGTSGVNASEGRCPRCRGGARSWYSSGSRDTLRERGAGCVVTGSSSVKPSVKDSAGTGGWTGPDGRRRSGCRGWCRATLAGRVRGGGRGGWTRDRLRRGPTPLPPARRHHWKGVRALSDLGGGGAPGGIRTRGHRMRRALHDGASRRAEGEGVAISPAGPSPAGGPGPPR